MAAVAREDSGDAASFYNMARNLGGSISFAIIGTVIDRRTTFHTAALRESVTANSLIGQDRLSAYAANCSRTPATSRIQTCALDSWPSRSRSIPS